MGQSGERGTSAPGVRVADVERALVLAREVSAATARGGAAKLRMEHLVALFSNGNGPVPPERMQAALEAAGLAVEPALGERPDAVSLRVARDRAVLSPARRSSVTRVARNRALPTRNWTEPSGPSDRPSVSASCTVMPANRILRAAGGAVAETTAGAAVRSA